MQGKIIVLFFLENSTRTKISFEIACRKLGVQSINFNSSTSSIKKGETTEDTVQVLSSMGVDLIILRDRNSDLLSKVSKLNILPVIDAGIGTLSHPTQSFLDLFTIIEYFKGDIKNKKVALVGDIKNSRVASSNIKLFKKVGIEVYLVAPKEFMPDINLPKYNSVEEIIDKVDIIICLRTQWERHNNSKINMKLFLITKELIEDRNIMIMHPGPVMRNIDISDEVLKDKRCQVLEQVKNSIFIRMAFIYLALS